MSAIIEPVRGMRDILPGEQYRLADLQRRLEAHLALYGYAQIELPIVEYRALYQRKLGEELVGKVYEFTFGGRELALRPELTASVLRSYVAHLQDQPLPLRLCYSGPVFRYERPQRSTYRQFTQTGVELIGGPAPRADAEVVALACDGLDQVGVTGYRVVLGHIGLVRELLIRLGLTERTRGLLAWSLERLRTQGVAAVRARLAEDQGDLPFDPALLDGMDDEQIAALLLRLLPALQVDLTFGSRPPEAIVARLLRKLRRDDPQPRIERALDLLERLSRIAGPPATALPEAADLLAATGLESPALAELQAITELLAAHGIPPEQLVVDFGLGRGLNYYTGMIFEIYADAGLQLAGGGRYDDLVTTLGGNQATPAVGFAYGLERVAAALPAVERAPARPAVLVAAVGDDDYAYALVVARRLREQGLTVMVDVRQRNVTANLRDAARRNLAYVAIVGPDERARNEVVWRNLQSREEQRVRLEEIGLGVT